MKVDLLCFFVFLVFVRLCSVSHRSFLAKSVDSRIGSQPEPGEISLYEMLRDENTISDHGVAEDKPSTSVNKVEA